jgi:hypothetical protein
MCSKQFATGKVTKPFGLLITVLERDNLPLPTGSHQPGITPPPSAAADPAATTDEKEPSDAVVLPDWSDSQCRDYYEAHIRPNLPAVSQARRPSNKVIRMNVAQHLKDNT